MQHLRLAFQRQRRDTQMHPMQKRKETRLVPVSAARRGSCPGSPAWHHSRCHAASQATLLSVHLGVLLFPEAWKNNTEAAWLLGVGSGFWQDCALQVCGSRQEAAHQSPGAAIDSFVALNHFRRNLINQHGTLGRRFRALAL